MITVIYLRGEDRFNTEATFDANEIRRIREITFENKIEKIYASGESATIVGFLLNRPVGEFVRVFGDDAAYCCANWEFGYEKVTRDLDTK